MSLDDALHAMRGTPASHHALKIAQARLAPR
jgi:hypothetical protein